MNIFVTFIVVAVVSGSSPKDAAIRNQLVIMHDMSDLYDRSMTELTSFAGFSRFMIGDAEAMVDNVVYAHAIMRDSQSMHARHRVDDGSTLSSSPIGVTIDGATQLQVVAGHYQDAMTRLVQTLPLSQEPTLASHIAALTQVSNEWKRIAVRAKVHRATLIRDRETLESSWPSAEPITTSMDPNEFAEPVTTRAQGETGQEQGPQSTQGKCCRSSYNSHADDKRDHNGSNTSDSSGGKNYSTSGTD